MQIKTIRLCFSLAAVPLVALAQENKSSNPLVATQKGFFSMVSHSAIAAAEKMPEADYAFKPTPEVRSFGQLAGHIADAQYGMCSAASGEQGQMKNIEKSKTSKADLVQSLKDAAAYCDKVFSGVTDAQASQTVKMFGRELPKLTVLSICTAHTDEHYGNMVTYLRMKGIVPPSSEGRR